MATLHKVEIDGRVYELEGDEQPPTEEEARAAIGGTISAGPGRPPVNWAREAAIMAASSLPYAAGAAFPPAAPFAPAVSAATDIGLRAAFGEEGEATRSIAPNLATLLAGPLSGALKLGGAGAGALKKLGEAGVHGTTQLLGYLANVGTGQEEYSNLRALLAGGLPLAARATVEGVSAVPRLATKVFAGRAANLAQQEEIRHSKLYDALAGYERTPTAADKYQEVRNQGAGKVQDIIELRSAQQVLQEEESRVTTYAPGFRSSGVARIGKLPPEPTPPQGAPIIAPNGQQAVDFYDQPMFSNPTPQQLQDYDDLKAVYEGRNISFDDVWRLKHRINLRLQSAKAAQNPDKETIGAIKLARSAIQDDIDNANISPLLKEADKQQSRELSLMDISEATQKHWQTMGGVDSFDANGMLRDFMNMRYTVVQGKARPIEDKFFAAGFKPGELDEIEKTFRTYDRIARSQGGGNLTIRASIVGGAIGTEAGVGPLAGSAAGIALPGMMLNLAMGGPKVRQMLLLGVRAGKGQISKEMMLMLSQVAEQERAARSVGGPTEEDFTIEVLNPDEEGEVKLTLP